METPIRVKSQFGVQGVFRTVEQRRVISERLRGRERVHLEAHYRGNELRVANKPSVMTYLRWSGDH